MSSAAIRFVHTQTRVELHRRSGQRFPSPMADEQSLASIPAPAYEPGVRSVVLLWSVGALRAPKSSPRYARPRPVPPASGG